MERVKSIKVSVITFGAYLK